MGTTITREGLEDRARAIHRARMEDWATDREYEEQVVARVVGAVEGSKEAPYIHEHAIEEMGMCVDCDAAMVIVRLEEDED